MSDQREINEQIVVKFEAQDDVNTRVADIIKSMIEGDRKLGGICKSLHKSIEAQQEQIVVLVAEIKRLEKDKIG